MTSGREMSAAQWQAFLRRRVFCAADDKFITFEQATHEWDWCKVRPTVDYSRPSGELRSVGVARDGLNVYEINKAREVPAVNDAYDKDAWERALALLH
jgi:hypothetical protein